MTQRFVSLSLALSLCAGVIAVGRGGCNHEIKSKNRDDLRRGRRSKFCLQAHIVMYFYNGTSEKERREEERDGDHNRCAPVDLREQCLTFKRLVAVSTSS